jgi:hypothetical protein
MKTCFKTTTGVFLICALLLNGAIEEQATATNQFWFVISFICALLYTGWMLFDGELTHKE